MDLSFRINTIVIAILASLCIVPAQHKGSTSSSPALDNNAQIKQISEAIEEMREQLNALTNMFLNKGPKSSLSRNYMDAFAEKGSLFRDYMNAFPGPVPQYPQPPQKPQDGYEYPVLIIPESSFYSKPYPGYPHPGPEQRYALPPSLPPAYPRPP